MKKRQMIFGIGIVSILAALFTWNFSRGNRTSTTSTSPSSSQTATASTSLQTDTDLSGENDVLVVYFSRTEGVWDGPLEIGHTKVIADFITSATNADQYEIIPLEAYPEEYEATAEQARAEQEADARPAIANALPDISGYETIFIGSPVWWSEYPMIVRTFLDAEAEELADKTLIPFTTHLGSGLGNTQRQLESQFPNARILDGFTIRGEDETVANAEQEINDWLVEIGVTE
ncbi:TPA: NAD(P)H-dependent oxidoreductase [Streptococcus suis]|uniref:flavodoxin n=1 Tax=Streptococcus suis TaxID=1307 RepID=UPI00209AE901|nr:flavodoxin [Streptococcus suis]MCO8174372.1 NAD(P)H-dependent oxidoreductase [Streptococcus suis]MCO8208772.1 NAD(P)H-dependent oxidoreductase [Streptococcus suis]HEM3488807.1 NAD(P)H-dependent oxidoreductase [Streptococcus suis]HEM3506801.1 NAD(P)H-dependent oxidoreductase [Streptococcus suis]